MPPRRSCCSGRHRGEGWYAVTCAIVRGSGLFSDSQWCESGLHGRARHLRCPAAPPCSAPHWTPAPPTAAWPTPCACSWPTAGSRPARACPASVTSPARWGSAARPSARAYAELRDRGLPRLPPGLGQRRGAAGRGPGATIRGPPAADLGPARRPTVIDLTCASMSAPAGTVAAYERALEQLPRYLAGDRVPPARAAGSARGTGRRLHRRGAAHRRRADHGDQRRAGRSGDRRPRTALARRPGAAGEPDVPQRHRDAQPLRCPAGRPADRHRAAGTSTPRRRRCARRRRGRHTSCPTSTTRPAPSCRRSSGLGSVARSVRPAPSRSSTRRSSSSPTTRASSCPLPWPRTTPGQSPWRGEQDVLGWPARGVVARAERPHALLGDRATDPRPREPGHGAARAAGPARSP